MITNIVPLVLFVISAAGAAFISIWSALSERAESEQEVTEHAVDYPAIWN